MIEIPATSSQMILKNIGQLVTLEPLAQTTRWDSISMRDLGILGPQAWLAIGPQGTVHGSGQGALPAEYKDWPKEDAAGGLVLPGLVDSHTHPLWAGTRDDEFVKKAAGISYQDIADQGGGILATVRRTRTASDAQLMALLKHRLQKMVSQGSTTIEVKSGYGLSVSEELRHLRLLHQATQEWSLSQRGSVTLRVTCLALHAHSPDFTKVEDYIAQCCQELLPEAQRLGYTSSVDAFVERGYFTPKMVEPYLQKAQDLGLMIRLHADEFQESGAAQLGASWGARSLDHLQWIASETLSAVATAKTVATLLPGTSLYSKLPWAQGRPLRQHGIPVALASDYNPGSCLISNLPLVASLGAVHCGLSLQEVIAGVTLIPAYGLGLTPHRFWEPLKAPHDREKKPGWKGALSVGYDGDFLLYPHSSASQWLADFGQTLPSRIWLKGAVFAGTPSGI